ncbi:MAG TPA: hypothetical protein DCS17_01450 [Flavobacterium sp.]|nr:hypothetical protein [Flavobacterium sp.]
MIPMTIDLNEATKDINKQVKFAVITLGIIVGLVLLFLLGRWIYKILTKDETVDDAEKQLNKENLTQAPDWYSQKAATLIEAVDNGLWGLNTDEQTIYNTMLWIKTKDDWRQLVVEFGTHKDRNLPEWLIYVLDSYQVQYVNKLLAPAGVSI